jgi:Ala-tRNA(Pro) deacylase
MPVQKLRKFLDEGGVSYEILEHSPAYTAQEIAAAAHVSGKELAKTVMVKIDGRMAMAVIPASTKVDLDQFLDGTIAQRVELAREQEFEDRFPDCAVGAMPPFGNLYGMDVYVSSELTDDDEIAFNAGSLTELIRLSYRDFERLVRPKVLSFAETV